MAIQQKTVSEVMQRDVLTLHRNDRLHVADGVMLRNGIRHVPVLDQGCLVGVVSNRDLNAAALSRSLDFEPMHREAFLRSIRIADVMTSDVVSVRSDETLRDAARKMVCNRIGCLPVVERGNRFIGLVTETDLLCAALLDEAPESSNDDEPVETSKLEGWVEEGLEDLERFRDEIVLQVHLGKADAKDLWDELDQRRRDTTQRVRRLMANPRLETARAARALIDDVRDDLQRLSERIN